MSNPSWLPDFIKRSRDPSQGDVIAADVGEDARGVAVGKNIVQIGTIKIPVWAIVAVVLGIAGIAVFSGYSIFSNQAQFQGIMQTVSATPTPTPVPEMTGSFNVAIAEFRVEGQGEGLEIAERLVQDFANAVESTVTELEGELGKIDFRAPQETGQIAGEDAHARAESARTLAQQINADIVVYGIVSVDGEKATIKPEFYINESVNNGLVEAWEITGQYEMGQTLLVEQISNRNLRNKTAQELLDRFHALTSIIDGLSAYVVGDYESANERFSQALAQDAWNNREVLYVMLGGTLVNQGLLEENPSLFTDAEGYFRQAIEANSKYSRAYAGLASALYERARSNAGARDLSDVDSQLLDESIRTYERALQPDLERPPLADQESKVHFGLGQAYLLQALVTQQSGQPAQASELLGQAMEAFQSVIDEYQGASPESQKRLQERAAHSHARLGLIYRYTNRLAEAEQQYEQALAMVPEHQRTRLDRARYAAALGEIDLKQGELEEARKRYEQAAALAPDHATEKPGYQAMIAQIQAQMDEGGQ